MLKAELVEANRLMWDETAAIHERVTLTTLLEQVGAHDFSSFDFIGKQLFQQLELRGKAVAQLSCNNARELISVKKAGAGRCVGFDISEKFIEQGMRLTAAAGVEVELLRMNVYDVPACYDDAFDLVYLTVGALGWLPDLGGFFDVAAGLMKPGAQLLIYEMHPLLDVFDDQNLNPANPDIARSYFLKEPIHGQDLPDYFDQEAIVHSESYWCHHTMADVIGSVLKSGLTLTSFEEYPHDVSGVYAALERCPHPLPLSYSLTAKKAAHAVVQPPS